MLRPPRKADAERLVAEALGRTIAKATEPDEVLFKLLWGCDPPQEGSVISEAVEVFSRDDRAK